VGNLHDFKMKDIDGRERDLATLDGKVVLVVNVASRCGLTPQYDGLERLYGEFGKRGLEILGFPCNQFMQQEPGSEAEIKKFCSLQYGVTFPMFSKLEVNGPGRAPLYAWLAADESGPEPAGDIKWNFGKFLIGKDGAVRARFAPKVEPCSAEVKQAVEAALAD
jgi:glutathione peroxidase